MEAISSRLRQTLIHPDKAGILRDLHYLPDGRSLLAGGAASGVVQVWDARSGRQRTRIDTGPRRSVFSNYLRLSPDGRLLYVNRGSLSVGSVKKDGKQVRQWNIVGGVSVWDLANGTSRQVIRAAPPRGIYNVKLSPDAATLLTFEGTSGIYERRPDTFAVLREAKTGRQLVALSPQPAVVGPPIFSPDSKTLLRDLLNDRFETTGFQLLDAATGEVRRTIPLTLDHLARGSLVFAADGKLLAGTVYRPQSRKRWLKLWDPASGRELASFEGDKQEGFREPLFSPDGKRLAVANINLIGGRGRLLLIDVAKRQLLKAFDFGDQVTVRPPVFSPDGKWIAVIAQAVPEIVRDEQLQDVVLLPQPHIHLIEAASGEDRETIVAPPGVAVSLCFSPDSKTLASGGDGRVLLWDVTRPPGGQAGDGERPPSGR